MNGARGDVFMKNWLWPVVAVACSACSFEQDSGLVDQAVGGFHAQYNARKFDVMFNKATPEFQGAKPRDYTVKFFLTVRDKLGAFKSTKKVGWTDSFLTSGHIYQAAYQSDFESGSAVETFVYRIEGPAAKLMSYNVNSDALILK